MPETKITSFMIRFVEEDVSPGQSAAPAWRAVIRHVQSREEEGCTQVDELLAFIGRYVDLESAGAGEDVSHSDISHP